MRLTHDLMPDEIRRPQRPAGPTNFACVERADWCELRMARTVQDRQRLFEVMKRRASAKLAAFIFTNCKFFDRSMPGLDRDLELCIELSIEDRGAYVNYLPIERQHGRNEGWHKAMKACAESLPYGLQEAAGEFYD